MSGYEQRLAVDKAEIRRRVVEVGNRVEAAVESAVNSLLSRDRRGSYAIVLGDLPINREIRAINKACHAFVARHLPSAGHLRFVSSVLQMNVALERIGDYAVTIAREAVQLSQDLPDGISRDLRAFSEQACAVLREALVAFSEKDADLARKTRPRAKSAERQYTEVYNDLMQEGAGLPLRDAFALLAVFHRLERVSDQAKNISEETLFELTGEVKPPKRYEVLFVDDDGTTLAPLAAALASKAFPESGQYSCASISQPREPTSQLRQLAEEVGLELVHTRCFELPSGKAELAAYDVIVTLTPTASERLRSAPYSTAVLDWSIQDASAAQLREVGQQLSHEIQTLMILMRGEDAP